MQIICTDGIIVQQMCPLFSPPKGELYTHSPSLCTWLNLANEVLPNMTYAETSVVSWAMLLSFCHCHEVLSSQLAPENWPLRGSDLTRTCSLGPCPGHPIWAQQNIPGLSLCHLKFCLCYTAKSNCSTLSHLLSFSFILSCFSGFCPISWPGNPAPIGCGAF